MRLLLLGTSGCHLCEEAETLIRACLKERFAQWIEPVDIAGQEQWQPRYALRIPVLYHPGTGQELGWPFDQTHVEKFIGELNND
jgi:hypothetical protein